MSSIANSESTYSATTEPKAEWPILLAIASAVALLHILTNGRYGFHRDELQFLSDARHLDWGFVCLPAAHAIHRTHRSGDLRRIARWPAAVLRPRAGRWPLSSPASWPSELGGGRLAQFTAALAVALSPMPLFNGTEFQYTSFDFLWWVLIAYFVIRLLKSRRPRWWLAIGADIGIGLLTKYSIVFYIAGILAGVVLTPARRYLASHLVLGRHCRWRCSCSFPTSSGSCTTTSSPTTSSSTSTSAMWARAAPMDFCKHQFLICTNLFAAPLWLAGLAGFLLNRRYRMLAFMYLVPLALFFFGKGRGYYMAAGYPMLMAMGAVMGERWLPSLPALGHAAPPRPSSFQGWH